MHIDYLVLHWPIEFRPHFFPSAQVALFKFAPSKFAFRIFAPVKSASKRFALLKLASIKDAALRGFHVQSTVLSGTKELLKQRVNAFKEGSAKLGEEGKLLKISMQRMAFAANNENDAKEKNK